MWTPVPRCQVLGETVPSTYGWPTLSTVILLTGTRTLWLSVTSQWTTCTYCYDYISAILNKISDISVEMRHSVTTPAYVFRKMFDNVLYSLCSTKHMSVATLGPLLSRIPFSAHEPSGWIPLYTMVTFRPDISYAMAKKKAQRQSRVVSSIGWVGTAFFGITFLGITWVALSRRLRSQG